jgi:ubiquinone/menaquinone biosynthesis C-methylase UbiE
MQADTLDFDTGSIDLAIMIRVLHHIPDPSAEFNELSRVLAKDGLAILEVANYTHGRNRLRHALQRKKLPIGPVSLKSLEKDKDITPFVNHNPKTIIRQLDQAGLIVERILSVSNLRSTKLKKYMPHSIMLAIEGILQPTLAHGYFGPSVFLLVRKSK